MPVVNSDHTPEDYVSLLGLLPHPEGGFYKETYRADLTSDYDDFNGPRNVSTGIFYLLPFGHFSAFHRIRSDEMWHFYDGTDLSVYILKADGQLDVIRLGRRLEQGEQLQAVVPAGCWFASRVEQPSGFALTGCTVAPGFDFQDFEMAKRNDLITQFPDHRKLIEELTRDT